MPPTANGDPPAPTCKLLGGDTVLLEQEYLLDRLHDLQHRDPVQRRVDFATTVTALPLTAKEMNAKYKETSEGGLAVSVTLC